MLTVNSAAMNQDRRSYTTIDVAKRLGVSLQTVQRWVDSGRLKAWKTLGGHRRIDAQSAEELFEAQDQLLGGAPAGAAVPAALESAPGGVSVVVVDDNPIDRELIVSIIQDAIPGARIQVAGNGFQGLVMIARAAPQIVVTDIHLPHMDGFELVRNLLVDSATRPRVLIAVSALTAQELAEFGELPSDVVLVTKPVDRAVFVAALQRTG